MVLAKRISCNAKFLPSPTTSSKPKNEEVEKAPFDGGRPVKSKESAAVRVKKIDYAKMDPNSRACLPDKRYWEGWNAGLDWAHRIVDGDKSAD